MAPLVLEGATLGEKHRHYNTLVKTATADQTLSLEKINFEDNDIDNLLKIDVACSRRDVDYILNVLACDDMLYVSRAISQSTWLITENQYAHIINPQYLHNNLFPKMCSKAKNKLLLTIRLKLKDKVRVDEFFNFFLNKDGSNFAIKWLPGCSPAVIEKYVEEHAENVDQRILKMLCEDSFNILKLYFKHTSSYYKIEILKNCTTVIKQHTEEILDIFDSLHDYEKRKLGKKVTQIFMSNCPDRIINNFAKYCFHIDVDTFAKNIKKEDVKSFLLKQKDDEAVKNWFKFDNIKHFIKYLPKENRFQFIKSLTMDKSKEKEPKKPTEYALADHGMLARAQCAFAISGPAGGSVSTNAHIYRWYRYAPFNTAFTDLKKLIYVESNPSERNAIYTVLINCARTNQQHIQTLLEYYREKHINEPFKFKVQFVNTLLSRTNTHKFDENTWSILNSIFSSMDVYMESDNKVPFCIQAIIVYALLHNQEIPDIIEKKFEFNTLKDYRKKLNDSEQNIVFTYLYKHLLKTINKTKITNEAEMVTVFNTAQTALVLLKDWKKNLIDYPELLEKVKELCTLKKQHSWNVDLTELYNAEKKWRKYLFEESLVLHPSDEACVNALKHDPELLSRYESDVQALFCIDAISLKRVLRKLRIYWAQTVAQHWCNIYLDRLLQHKGQKAILTGLCTIMTRNQILPLIEKHAPTETKINWIEASDSSINLSKNIAKHMHLIRSSINLETILLYAKEDYLMYALPSLTSILYNMSANQTSNCIMKLLDTPVSLQKHGIRTAFQKLKIDEIKEMVQNIWKNTKNSSIKTVLFQQTFKILCKERNDAAIKEIWDLMDMYIDSLTTEENRIIYNTFTKVKKVPISVRPEFFMKGYKYLKSLPPKAKCDGNLNQLKNTATDIIHLLEPQFIEDMLLESATEDIITANVKTETNSSFLILSAYLLSSQTEESQMLKYEKLLVPVLDTAFTLWHQRHKGTYYAKINTTNLLNFLIRDVCKFTVLKKHVIPVKLFKQIETKMINALPLEDNYYMIMHWCISTLFVEELNKYIKDNPISETELDQEDDSNRQCTPWGCNPTKESVWSKICSQMAHPFGQAFIIFLKQETHFMKYPSLYSFLAEMLLEIFSNYNFSELDKCRTIKAMLADKDANLIFCVVIHMIHNMSYSHSKEEEAALKEIYKIIKSNTSSEVKIHLNHLANNRYGPNYDSDGEAEAPGIILRNC